MKNTKSVKSKFVRRIVTAIRDRSPVSPEFYMEPEVIKTDKKLSPNMLMAKKVLETHGKLSINDAATELLKIHKLRTDNFEQAKKIFLHASKYNLPVKITKEGKEKYVELTL